jgi:hypothetical protein
MHLSRRALLGLIALRLVQQMAFAQSDAVFRGSAITCIEGRSESVSMRSTSRLPEASGTVKVECRGGTTEIDVEFDSMKPASLFGGDYNTYVLWVVPPGGSAENLGEVLLVGDQARLQASTAARAFAVLVSAEPHYLVKSPSSFVVLETGDDSHDQNVEQPLISGVYNFSRSSLSDVKEANGPVHSEVRQAFTAVRLAERSGAARYAADELSHARLELDRTLKIWHERKDRTEIAAQARETIRLAVAAQRLAEERAFGVTRGDTEGSGGGKSESPGARSARSDTHEEGKQK